MKLKNSSNVDSNTSNFYVKTRSNRLIHCIQKMSQTNKPTDNQKDSTATAITAANTDTKPLIAVRDYVRRHKQVRINSHPMTTNRMRLKCPNRQMSAQITTRNRRTKVNWFARSVVTPDTQHVIVLIERRQRNNWHNYQSPNRISRRIPTPGEKSDETTDQLMRWTKWRLKHSTTNSRRRNKPTKPL